MGFLSDQVLYAIFQSKLDTLVAAGVKFLDRGINKGGGGVIFEYIHFREGCTFIMPNPH